MTKRGFPSTAILPLALGVLLASSCADPVVPPGEDAQVIRIDGGPPIACDRDAQCDDGVFCNGEETCASGTCAGGAVPDCDDAVACTTDRCDEALDRCAHDAPDADGDGATDAACSGTDCDDADPERFPGNLEICDAEAHDEDCDEATFGFRDADADGWPDAACCNGASCGSDCDDTLPTAHPSEAEVCDGVDNDCDEATDEGVLVTFHPDVDRDGFGDPAGATIDACFAPEGFADDADDCDDARGFVSPAAPEVCDGEDRDEDCDGTANPDELCNCTPPMSRGCLAPGVCAAGTQDCAGGMWGACSIAGSAEVCDGEDDDCDGRTDETLLVRCFEDADGDTYPVAGADLATLCPDPARTFVGGCPASYTDREPIGAVSLDCAETDAGRFPGATETCDAVDQDCDGAIDEMLRITCYDDADGDGYALGTATARDLCPPPGMRVCPMGSTSRAPAGVGTSDCDDANSARSPSAIETCNGTDDDCDGMIDDALRITCYVDGDRDGYAASGAASTQSCPDPGTGACPAGRTSRAPAGAGTTDCDDASATRAPSVAESCNAIDDDCDARTDEALLVTCYTDVDRDGYAPSTATGSMVCPASGGGCPTALTSRMPGPGATDCDDASTARAPSVTESCNSIDDDCDARIDEMLLVTCYTDADRDGYAPSGATGSTVCPAAGGGCPTALTSRMPAMGAIDCLDSSATRSPAVAETCNSIDDDCDMRVDEMLLLTCYADMDSDGYPPSGAAAMMLCPGGGGACPSMTTSRSPASGPIDCADTSAARSPAVAEACNAIDDDCDTRVDEGVITRCYVDADRDGFALMGAASLDVCGSCPVGRTPVAPGPGAIDCDDTNAGRSPVVPEICNTIDDDCDGVPDDGIALVARYVDADNDGYGTGALRMVCPAAAGYADADGDCRDDVFAAHPGQGGFFDAPMCPTGQRACIDGSSLPGCEPSDGSASCDPSSADFDYDCSRRDETDVPVGRCTSPGASCTIVIRCTGVGGYSPLDGDPCGRTVGTRGCSCEGPAGSTRCTEVDVPASGLGDGVFVRCH